MTRIRIVCVPCVKRWPPLPRHDNAAPSDDIFDIENDWLDHALREQVPDPQPEDNWLMSSRAASGDDDDGDEL